MLTEADRCQTPRLWGWHFTVQPRQSILASCHQKNNYPAFPRPYLLHIRFSSMLTVRQFGEPEEAEHLPEAPWNQSVWWGEGLRGKGELGLYLSEVPMGLVTSAVLLDCARVTRTKWTEAIASCYSSSSSRSSLNYFYLLPLSAHLQNSAHWTTHSGCAWNRFCGIIYILKTRGKRCLRRVLWKEGWGK